MLTIGDMPHTGRRISGPGSQLVELEVEGLRHTAIVFEPSFRGHASLNAELEVGMGFMTDPQVTGLVRLTEHIPDDGAFVYPTGTAWSVAELVRELAETGDVGGVKAGLELCYLVGEILVEASDQSVHSNLAGHGSLDPWRILIKADGQVAIIGYGLPRPEVENYLDNEDHLPAEDTLRYCAPEDLRQGAERGLSTDLFSLALIALELMVGKPVYDGLAVDVRNQAARAEAARRLYQWREKLPETVREVMGKALKPDPDIRFRDGLDFVYSVHDLLGGIDAGDGPSMRELVAKVRGRQRRGVAVTGGNTGALTRAELAELAADIDNEGVATDLPPPRQSRPEEEQTPGEKPRWRRSTRSIRGGEPEEPRRRRGRKEPSAGGESARDRLLRRLRERSEGEATSKPQRRRRPTPPEPEPEPPAAAPEPKKRRRRGGRAAALLERLRSSSDGFADPAAASADLEEATVIAPPIQASSLRAKPPSSQEAANRVDHTDLETQVVDSGLAKEALNLASTGVTISHEGRSVQLPWSGTATTASEAARLLGCVSSGLLGTLECGFWLARDDRALSVDAPEADAALHVVVNRPVRWGLTLPDGSTSVVVVGAAVPVGALCTALADSLGLDAIIKLESAGVMVDARLPAGLVDAADLRVRP